MICNSASVPGEDLDDGGRVGARDVIFSCLVSPIPPESALDHALRTRKLATRDLYQINATARTKCDDLRYPRAAAR